jgi:hypothetical protein
VGSLIFGVEPENDLLTFDRETFVQLGFTLAGKYFFVNADRLSDHSLFVFVHIIIFGVFDSLLNIIPRNV